MLQATLLKFFVLSTDWSWSLDSYANVCLVNRHDVPVLYHGENELPDLQSFPRVCFQFPVIFLPLISPQFYPGRFYSGFDFVSLLWASNSVIDPQVIAWHSSAQLDFYTKRELPFRLAIFWVSLELCSIFGSFLAVGVLRMRGVRGKAGWRWVWYDIYCGEFTILIIFPISWDGSSWLRVSLLFWSGEETIATTRILRDDPTKVRSSTFGVAEMPADTLTLPLRLREICTTARGCLSSDCGKPCAITIYGLYTWCEDYPKPQAIKTVTHGKLFFSGLMFGIPSSPPATYLTLSLRNLG
jgi:hypothetical protein